MGSAYGLPSVLLRWKPTSNSVGWSNMVCSCLFLRSRLLPFYFKLFMVFGTLS